MEIPLETFLDQIDNVTSSQISEVAMAVIERYRSLFPEWEIVLYSYPKEDGAMRRELLKTIAAMLEKTDG